MPYIIKRTSDNGNGSDLYLGFNIFNAFRLGAVPWTLRMFAHCKIGRALVLSPESVVQRGNPQQKYYNATEMFILNQLGWGVSGDFSGSARVRNASLFGGAVAAFSYNKAQK